MSGVLVVELVLELLFAAVIGFCVVQNLSSLLLLINEQHRFHQHYLFVLVSIAFEQVQQILVAVVIRRIDKNNLWVLKSGSRSSSTLFIGGYSSNPTAHLHHSHFGFLLLLLT